MHPDEPLGRGEWGYQLVDRILGPPHVPVRLAVDAHVLLKRSDQVGHKLGGHDDLGSHRSAHDPPRFGLADIFNPKAVRLHRR